MKVFVTIQVIASSMRKKKMTSLGLKIVKSFSLNLYNQIIYQTFEAETC